MTREEAIEVVRKNLPHLGIGATEMTDALKTLIPELRESEDERIRKELKEAFEAYDIESKWNGIPIRSIFAWLEKQKEQKPVSISCGHENDAEWTDEDEMRLNHLITFVEKYGLQFYASTNKVIEWLKSLRPSWKPSEEQMKVFDGLYHNYILDKNDYKVLESLYEQLKKL